MINAFATFNVIMASDDLDSIDAPTKPFPISEKTIVTFTLLALVPAVLRLLLNKLTVIRSRIPSHRHPPSPPPPPPPPPYPTTTNRASTPRYGLALGEALPTDDDNDNDDDDDNDVTARELRRLQQSPEFHQWCRFRRIHTEDLENTEATLKLYKRLRALHPPSFWLLCRQDTLTGFETLDPGKLLSLTEYVTSSLINIGVFALLFILLLPPLVAPFSESRKELWWWVVSSVVFWYFCWRQWMQARPSAGPLYSGWYEDVYWGHKAAVRRVVVAQLLETVFLLGTGVMVGGVISCCLRVFTKPHYCSSTRNNDATATAIAEEREDGGACGCGGGQSMGERIAGVRLVIERPYRLDSSTTIM